jgi:hypothetical protein
MKQLAALLIAITFALGVTGQAKERNALPDRVVVLGDVRAPGPVAYQEGMTFLQAVLKAGGAVEFAKARCFIVRRGKSSRVNLRTGEGETPLLPWDTIWVTSGTPL